jgi:hypothetical protein
MQLGTNSAKLLLQQQPQQEQHTQAGTSRQAPQDAQQPDADNSWAAKKPGVADMPPPPQQQQRRRSQCRSGKGVAAVKPTGARQQQHVVPVRQPLQELQQNVGGRQTRSSSRNLAATVSNSNNQKTGGTAGSSISGAARTGMLPAASAAAGKAAALLQSTMRSAKQQLLQMASSLGKRTHKQMQSGSKCDNTKK